MINSLAEILLCHQDMYVERLTKDMERLTQQIAMYEAQTNAQAEETQAAKEAFSEVTAVWHKTHTTSSVHLCNNSFYNQLLLISAINQAENSCLIIRHLSLSNYFCVCVQAEMEMESLVMARKQLLQQWNSSLVGMRRRDEAFSAMQEAVR